MANASRPLRQATSAPRPPDSDDRWDDLSDDEVAELAVLYKQADEDFRAGRLEEAKPV